MAFDVDLDDDNVITWECWVVDDKTSFLKTESTVDVQQWLIEHLEDAEAGRHLIIVAHTRGEYSSQ